MTSRDNGEDLKTPLRSICAQPNGILLASAHRFVHILAHDGDIVYLIDKHEID